jgi:long-chain acyl-CoA synthetase
MHPGAHAQTTPDKPAVIMARTGQVLTYRALDERSSRLAQLWWAAGLRPGDHVAIFADNVPEFFEVTWAAFRSGLYLTTVNRYLQTDEAAYIVNDCEAKALVVTTYVADVAGGLPELIPDCPVRLVVGGPLAGFDEYDPALAAHPAEPLAVQPRGDLMLYSSGTTGRPKGIKRPLSGRLVDDPANLNPILGPLYGVTPDTVYLSPAPLYHSAPLGFCAGVQTVGGTVVVMEKFDPAEALALIERYRVTHSQWVPTMFSRMLKLPDDLRHAHDLRSHVCAIHAAAPCPVEVKRQMIDWWGPILFEYYAGTEANGYTYVNSQDWLAHPGTVGRPILGIVHVCDETGVELPTGEAGTVYFERETMPFEYHNAPDKTRSSQHPEHANWSTLGDVGYVDGEGFLYLTDRKAFMIIAGGVNIYPQEIEDCLVLHPKVADVAVFGVPNEDLGEEVKAVVQPAEGVEGSEDFARELIAYAREHIAHFKVPRSVDFVAELPRLPTGKLYKRLLRDAYWGKTGSKIV